MINWPQFPVVYEINTWVWLQELSQRAGEPITLATVPQAELDRLAGYGFDGLWLMGVWRRSPKGNRVAREHPGLQAEYRRALPGYAPEDVVGSPYAVLDYTVDPALGGDAGLADLRSRLADLSLRMMLDFVPNHMAVDHPWLETCPEHLVQGDADRLTREPGNYFSTTVGDRGRIFAHGRDPYHGGWTDTVQIDYRSAATRRAMTDILLALAERCDGLRCDMAMLIIRDIFCRTWGGDFHPVQAEFWPCAITDVKAQYPGFLMLAEAYWDMEWELQQQGFDYTYDKRLYDRLLNGDALAVEAHLRAGMDFQRHLARFLENHDERRAIEAFGAGRSEAAALLTLSLPGLRLLHDGQLEGRQVRLPVQLGRRQPEPELPEMDSFYRKLLSALRDPAFHEGEWALLQPEAGWPGNASFRDLVAHHWALGDRVWITVANLSAAPAQALLPIPVPVLAGREWLLHDRLNDQVVARSGDDMVEHGLYVDVPAYGYHLFQARVA